LAKHFLCANSPSKSSRLIKQYQVQQKAQLEEYRNSEELLRAAIRGRDNIDDLNEILAISARTPQLRKRQLNTFLMTLRHGVRSMMSQCFAVVMSSLIFGLVHSDWGLPGMVQASCIGAALGVSYLIVGRNLWVTILAHAYMDTLLILQMYWAQG